VFTVITYDYELYQKP